MRETLFRGIPMCSKGFIEGDLTHINDDCYIGSEGTSFTRCVPDTVGQFTGLTDKNGVKIFEGDVVKYIYSPNRQDGGFVPYYGTASVEYNKTRYILKNIIKGKRSSRNWSYQPMASEKLSHLEVVGNIHDNPELLK